MTTKDVLEQSLRTIHQELGTQLAFFRHGGDFNESVILRVTNEMFLRVVEAALIEFESKNAGENILTGNKVTPEMYQIGKLMASLRQEGGNEL